MVITGVIEKRGEGVVGEMCARAKCMKRTHFERVANEVESGETGNLGWGVRSTSHVVDGGCVMMSTHGWRGNAQETMLRVHCGGITHASESLFLIENDIE